MVDSFKLKQHINSSGYKKSYIAEKLGLTRYGLDLKINNPTRFRSDEIYTLKKILHLDDEDFLSVFFADDADNLSTFTSAGSAT